MALSKTFPKNLNEDNGNAENQFVIHMTFLPSTVLVC